MFGLSRVSRLACHRVSTAMAFSTVIAVSGCSLFQHSGRFEQFSSVTNEHGTFKIFVKEPRSIDGIEAGKGIIEKETVYYVLIGTQYFHCGFFSSDCEAVVNAVFEQRRINTEALANSAPILPEPEGGFPSSTTEQEYTPPAGYSPPAGYTPPVEETPEEPEVPEVSEEET